jgi:sortase A
MRAVVRGFGEILITAGLIVLLFVAYELVWTNVEANRHTDQVSNALRDQWADPPHASGHGAGNVGSSTFVKGKGFAFLHIPALGRNWSRPVVQGVSLPDLARGVGHYPKTALPGEVGNFAVAGHRATNGEPFAYLDKVHVGDVVVAETRTMWFTYVVDRTKIVAPDSFWVLDPVPGHPNRQPTQRLLTLTTCNPRWASFQRLIVFGHLEEARAKSAGPPAVLLHHKKKATA